MGHISFQFSQNYRHCCNVGKMNVQMTPSGCDASGTTFERCIYNPINDNRRPLRCTTNVLNSPGSDITHNTPSEIAHILARMHTNTKSV